MRLSINELGSSDVRSPSFFLSVNEFLLYNLMFARYRVYTMHANARRDTNVINSATP